MRKTSRALLVFAFAGVLLSSCGPKDSSSVDPSSSTGGGEDSSITTSTSGPAETRATQTVTGPYLPGRTAFKDYNAIMSYNAETFNPVISQSGSDGRHIANFIDGLLENDEFGRLTYALAESATTNAANDVFTFKIKEGIKWVKSDGTQYVANIGGDEVPQFVTPADFIAAVRMNADFFNDSETYYIPAMFIKGAAEYWAYTLATYLLSVAGYVQCFNETYSGIETITASVFNALNKDEQDAVLARAINLYAWYYHNIFDGVVNPADVDSIADGERIGVRDAGDNKVEFTLNMSAPFFPSVLTYTCFLPVNEAFINEVGFGNFGSNVETMIYNGAFTATKWTETEIEYTKNPEYWDKNAVHLDKVHYTVYPSGSGYDYLRTLFENGDIDGFNVNDLDEVGWKKYVTGEDNTGTLENPAHGAAYSRYIETIDYAYHLILNLNRDSTDEWEEGKSTLTAAEVENFNRAVRLHAVRKLFLKGIDLKEYNKSRGADTRAQDEIQIHTYTAKNFAIDEDGNDYVQKYVYEAFDNANISELRAEEVLALGQTNYNGVTNFDDTQVQELVADAKAEVAAWNAAHPEEEITWPLKTEYLGLPDSDQNRFDQGWIDDFNERTNGCTIKADSTSGLPQCDGGVYPDFQMNLIDVTITVDSKGYQDLGYNGQYGMFVMGWGPDYADPLTYLNTYVTAGDMAQFSGDDDLANPVPGYRLVEGELVEDTFTDTDGTVHKGIAAKYNVLVDEAKAITDNTALRYEKFAEAEIELLFGMDIVRMSQNMGQGWYVTVSRTMGYEMPTAAYGLSSFKLKGLWVLQDILDSATRKTLKAQYDQAKAAIEPTDEGVFSPEIV